MTLTTKKCLIALFFTFVLGVNIFSRSDFPPYGHPFGELSDNYWGVMVDIAHRWRSFDFSVWNRELGGGSSLFTSGLYPILSPTNILAWVFNDDPFFLIKLIEPYLIGFFFMTVLLWDVFKTRWYLAVLGGFAYMGLPLCKTTTIVESSYFLYGCGLFPAMVYAAMKLSRRHIYLSTAGAGSLVALQFLMEGVTQTPQMVIWWTIFFTVFFLISKSFAPKTWTITLLVFFIAAIGLCAVQLLPSLHFFRYESARVPGHYAVNSFPLFVNPHGPYTLAWALFSGIVLSGPIRFKVFLVLVLGALSLAILHFGRIFAKSAEKKWVYILWTTTVFYFLLSPTIAQLASWFPVLLKFLAPLTQFSFHYALHTVDFCIILSLCLILDDESLSWKSKSSWLKKGPAAVIFLAAVLVVLLPMILFLLPPGSALRSWVPLESFVPGSLQKGTKILFNGGVLLFLLALRPRHPIRHVFLISILLGMGFMMLLDCFKWYDKGCRNHIEEFQLNSPEHDYYRRAEGKYLLPYDSYDPKWILRNYNLLYGVHGTSGYMGMAPRRIVEFAFYYNRRFADHMGEIPFFGGAMYMSIDGFAPASFTTYFPVDFTLVPKSASFDWEGFEKVVEGDKYDVYERVGPTPRVHFANQLNVMSFQKLLLGFDQPRSSKVMVTKEDAARFSLTDRILSADPAQASYQNFLQTEESRLSFQVTTAQDIYVVVPERYESGWTVRVDGQKVSLFPANYLFIGFQVPAGIHAVEMEYSLPWLWAGLMTNVLAVGFFIFLFYRVKFIRNERIVL